MSNVFQNPTPFDIWLYGFPCYDKYLSLEKGTCNVDGYPYPINRNIDYNLHTRRVFRAFWFALCSPQDVCERCAGCNSGLDAVIIDYPFKDIPYENENLSGS